MVVSSGGRLVNRVMNLRFCKRRGISWLAVRLLAFQEMSRSMKFQRFSVLARTVMGNHDLLEERCIIAIVRVYFRIHNSVHRFRSVPKFRVRHVRILMFYNAYNFFSPRIVNSDMHWSNLVRSLWLCVQRLRFVGYRLLSRRRHSVETLSEKLDVIFLLPYLLLRACTEWNELHLKQLLKTAVDTKENNRTAIGGDGIMICRDAYSSSSLIRVVTFSHSTWNRPVL